MICCWASHNQSDLQRGAACGCASPRIAPTAFDAGAAQAPTWRRCAIRRGARGRQRIDRLHLSSDAPLGLFRAWTWLHLPLEALIYPAPVRLRPPPASAGQPRRSERERRLGGDEEWRVVAAIPRERPAAQRGLEGLRARRRR